MPKSAYVLFALISCIAFSVNAQKIIEGTSNVNTPNTTGFGAKAGANISNFVGDDFHEVTPQIGVYLGIFIEKALSEKWFFQPEGIVSFRGVTTSSGEVNNAYLNFPLMLKHHFTNEFALEFGPQLGVLVASNSEDYVLASTRQPLAANSTHIGANMGMGYGLTPDLYVQLRYSLGLNRVLEASKARNQAFQFGVGYFF